MLTEAPLIRTDRLRWRRAGSAFKNAAVPSLVSYIDRDNTRSIRLAERLGAVRDDATATPNGDPCLVFRHLPV